MSLVLVKYFDQLDVNVKPEHIPPITENFTFLDYIHKQLEDALQSYVDDHFQEAYRNGWRPSDTNKELSKEELMERFKEELMDERFLRKHDELIDGKAGITIFAERLVSIIDDYQLHSEIQLLLNEYYIYFGHFKKIIEEYKQKIKIAGLFVPDPSLSDDSALKAYHRYDMIVVNDTLYEEMVDMHNGYYSLAIGPMPNKKGYPQSH